MAAKSDDPTDYPRWADRVHPGEQVAEATVEVRPNGRIYTSEALGGRDGQTVAGAQMVHRR
jgi:hypothetical protein